MRLLPLAAALALALAAPAGAQTTDEPAEPDTGKPLSEEIQDVIRGLVESVEPALERLRDTFSVFERVDSLEHYREPEILPNGDIVIRRKEDAPPYEPEPVPETERAPGAEPPETEDRPDGEPGVRT